MARGEFVEFQALPQDRSPVTNGGLLQEGWCLMSLRMGCQMLQISRTPFVLGNAVLRTAICLGSLLLLMGPLFAQENRTDMVPVKSANPDGGNSAKSPALTVKPNNQIPTTFVEMCKSLGYWTIPFGFCTLVAVWLSVERMVVLRRGRVIPKAFVERFLRLLEDGELEPAEALQICEENGSPVAMIFAHGIRKWGKMGVEVEQAIIDGGERQVASLRTHLRMLNGISTISPLLGLLGTVMGMLKSFGELAASGSQGRSEDLAKGIALALVATAFGLFIAIPALAVYMYFSSRVDALVMEMDDLSQRLVHSISAEALADRASRPRRVAKAETEAPAKKKAV